MGAVRVATPAVAGRKFNFVYFGGGTPSFLSTKQLQGLVGRLNAGGAWNAAEEITFECEPGTLSEAKLAAIREMGVTRLSLGVENFDDRILEINGRAHRSPEIGRAYAQARKLGFPQINIDLIAGMLGETDANWKQCIERTLALDPDSVTIYQMELPYNTTISGDLLKQGGQFSEPVAGWATKRRWVQEAFSALERAGYHVGSAYTAVKNPATTKFVYRDRLWEGADLLGLGVASFGHINGVHVQNVDTWPKYQDAINRGEIPAGPGVSPERRRAADPRVRAAVEARRQPPVVFRAEVRRRRAGAVQATRSTRWPPTATWPSAAPTASPSRAKACCASTCCSPDSSCLNTPASATPNFQTFNFQLSTDCMILSEYDVVVIGGGPAGSTTSTLLAQGGLKVGLFEREKFPRFHIGESLIPETYWVLKRLNMLEKMQRSHFVKKYSVQFINANGKLSAPFYFWDNKPHECSQTWQVVRSEFDHMMLDNAREHGVDAHDGVHVIEVLFDGEPRRRRRRSSRTASARRSARRSSSTPAARRRC